MQTIMIIIIIIIIVLNSTPQRLVCPIVFEVYRPGRCNIQIFDHTSDGPVHPTCLRTYQPANKYFSRPVYYTTIWPHRRASDTPNLFSYLSDGRCTPRFSEWKEGFIDVHQSTIIQNPSPTPGTKPIFPIRSLPHFELISLTWLLC